MNLIQCYFIENQCYKIGTKIKPRGIMVHSTGANNPMLRRYVQPAKGQKDEQRLLNLLGVNKNGNSWNQYQPGGRQVCVHGFVGKLADGSVAAVQTLPWDCRGWHAGVGSTGKSANDSYIGFECCEDGLTDPKYFAEVYQTAVELVAHLCKIYNLDPSADGVVICHQDGYRMGIASNHGDIYNWFPKHGKNMETFRQDVIALMKPAPVTPAPQPPKEDEKKGVYEREMKYYRTIKDVPEYYKPTIEKCMADWSLKGTGDGEINVSEDMCRILTVLDRRGKL